MSTTKQTRHRAMKLSDALICDIQTAAALAAKDTDPGWLSTVARALESCSRQIMAEVDADHAANQAPNFVIVTAQRALVRLRFDRSCPVGYQLRQDILKEHGGDLSAALTGDLLARYRAATDSSQP